jgi:(2Fe-2S) ferredoxin
VFNAFLAQFQQRNLWNDFQVTSTGCLGPCQAGPSVLVYPEGIMYAGVKPSDVASVINEHLIGGTPVAHLVAPEAVWS